MNRLSVIQLIRWLGILGILAAVLSIPSETYAQSPPNPFLSSPYYGTRAPTQCFHATHTGLDFGLFYEPVLAASAGTVIRVQWANNTCHQYYNQGGDFAECDYGLHIYIQHDNGYVSRYGHLSATAFDLGTTNVRVSAGQVIGTSGNTGYSSAAHLHFEVGIGNFSRNGGTNPGAPEDPCHTNNVLWKDGHFVGHPIQAPAEDPAPLIVDDSPDQTGGFYKGSGGRYNNTCPPGYCPYWYQATGVGYASDMHWTLANGSTEDYWTTWEPTYPNGGGTYEVEVYTPSDNATSWQAPFTVEHAQGTTTTRVDQYGLFNRWVTIGRYKMQVTNMHLVYATDATGAYETSSGTGGIYHCGAGVDCKLGIDALRFKRRNSLFQTQWRGDQSWSRAIFVDGTPQWYSPSSWVSSNGSGIGYLPGSGPLQTESMYVIGNTLWHAIWRNNVGYSRTIPITNGEIEWAIASAWSTPLSISVLAGSGDMQSQSDYRVGNTLWQAYWRGNQGWSRTVPIVNNVPQWLQAAPWSGGYGLNVLAGIGDMQAQTDLVIGNTIHQFHWRSNQGWYRQVQIVNGVPQWPAWGWEPAPASDVPGSGTLQTRSDFVLP